MLNIVVPMAGRGQRFADAGFRHPKPLIPVHGIPMARVVIENIRPRRHHRFIFVCLDEHLKQHGLGRLLRTWTPGCEIMAVPSVTQGAACTVLLARSEINTEDPLMLANCDQWVDIEIDTYLAELDQREADGLIMTMSANDAKWSYVRRDESGWVCQVAEKQVISQEATVGIYNFRRGLDFVAAAEQMIAVNERVNNEFYVAPVYNHIIARGKKVASFNVGRELAGMYGLGIPDDLRTFEQLPVSKKILSRP